MNKGDDGRGIYRAIYTSLWDDPDFRKLSPETKLVFLNIRTSPLTNIPCIYNFYFEAIEKQTGLSKAIIKKSLDTLCHTLFIEIEDGIVWVRKGLKFDPNIILTNPKHTTAVKKIILSLPKLKIVKNFIDFYKLDIPYPIPYANQEPKPKPEPEKEKDIEEEEIKISFRENVVLSKKEYDHLKTKFGSDTTERMLDTLDNYKGAHGKKYKSDYRAILSWVAEKVQQKPGGYDDADKYIERVKRLSTKGKAGNVEKTMEGTNGGIKADT